MVIADVEIRLLRVTEVIQITGLHRSAIYAAIDAGTFPKPRKIASQSVRWRTDEIQDWIKAQPVGDPINRKGKPKGT